MAYIQDIQESVPALPEAGNLTSFVVLSQNENGRRLNFKIVGVDIPSGSTATFSGTKPDGVVYSTTGEISGNVVTVNEDIQMTAVAGSWDAKIHVLNGGNVIASAKVRITIDADPVAPGSIPSDSQLDGIVAECQAYAESARSSAYGSPLTASTAAGMIDKTRVYVYTGSETGYTNGHWYYWDGTAWADGGTYNSSGIQTDTTLSVPGMAADAKAAGDEIANLKEDLKLKADLPTETIENVSIASFNDGAEDCPVKELKVGIEPIQSGSGDPSPTNVRPISGRDSVTVTRTGLNGADSQTYTIPLSSTIYGGTLDVGTGVLTVDRAMVDLGDLTWGYSISGQLVFGSTGIQSTIGDGATIICENYKTTTNLQESALSSVDKVIGCNKANSKTTGNFAIGSLIVKDTAYTDATTFKNAMSGVHLCYNLATPTTVQLTPAQVTTLLKDNNIFADSGNIVKLIYRADLGAYIEKLINA